MSELDEYIRKVNDANLSGKEKRNSSDILKEYRIFQKELMVESITVRQFEILNLLQIEYNLAVLFEANLGITDYVENGIVTSGFEDTQNPIGDYQVDLHYGVDAVGDNLQSPFFLQSIGGKNSGSNDKIFAIIGTELKMRIKHGDEGNIIHDTYSPGDKIMPFPKNNNANIASTAPHFHIDISNGNNFLNPFTFQISNTKFKQSFNGGKSWFPVNSNY